MAKRKRPGTVARYGDADAPVYLTLTLRPSASIHLPNLQVTQMPEMVRLARHTAAGSKQVSMRHGA